MTLLRKFLAVRKLDSELPEDVRAALVDSVYAPFNSLVMGAVSGAIIGGMVSYRSGDVWLLACSLSICAVCLGRIVLARAYYRRATPDTPATVRSWEQHYRLGAWAYSGLLGLLCFFSILRSADIAIHLVVATTTAGYAAGITGRNAGRPVIAIGQLQLATLPLAAGLLLHHDPLHRGFGVVILLFAYGMTEISLSIRDIVVHALVTTREKAALASRFEEQANRFNAALNNMSHGLVMFDRDGRLLVWNERFMELSGLAPDSVRIGTRARDVLQRSVKAGGAIDVDVQRLCSEIEAALAPGASGRMVATLNGQRIIALTRRFMSDGGSVVIFEDITERRLAEERISRMARFDELTGLRNRTSFRERIDETLNASLKPAIPFALHLIDLDTFKAVNDTLGHPMGDRLLQAVAERLKAIVVEPHTLARFGGDEFVVLQAPLADATSAADLAERMVEALKLPFEVEGHRIDIGASIGIALAPEHGADADKLMKSADIALYAAKAAGRNAYRFFEAVMDTAAQARRQLELDLRDALGRGEFRLVYQPIVDLATGRVSGCEALLRWRHPTRGLVSPVDFIPVAEETGLIVPIGDWVLQEACREAATWPDEVRVAVNLSPVQFREANLPTRVMGALARSSLPASRLELEITETAMLQGTAMTLGAMNQLQQLGVRMSLDDFGTGYSSLSYLRKFPFQKIKIDASFVRDLGRDGGSIAIVRAVSGMGNDLGMTIVVEGVETQAQLDLVKREGCNEAQGYLLGRPMSASALRRLFSEADGSARHVA